MIDFLGIGAQKAATTWLYEHLSAHPSIHFPAGKEAHFWDMRAQQGGAAWLSKFPDDEKRRQGEITPAYAILPRSTIEEMRRWAPGLKLFFCLRDPRDRAWSQALMRAANHKLGIDSLPDDWFIEYFTSPESRERGTYTACLDNWLSVYSAQQLCVLLFDDVVARPQEVLARLALHLDVDPAYYAEISPTLLGRPVHAGPRRPARPRLDDFLRDLYASEIEALSLRLGRDLAALWR